MKGKCCETTNNKLITFKENSSKLIINNVDKVKVEKIKVDGCEIISGKRCDYLCIIHDMELYIELKGQDLEHAIKQIEETIKKLSVDSKKKQKKSFIICTRSPLNSASIQNLKIKFKKYFNSELIIKSSPYTHIEKSLTGN